MVNDKCFRSDGAQYWARKYLSTDQRIEQKVVRSSDTKKVAEENERTNYDYRKNALFCYYCQCGRNHSRHIAFAPRGLKEHLNSTCKI